MGADQFVVIDDNSSLSEEIPGEGIMNTHEVCQSFQSDRIIYRRNTENIGVAGAWKNYYHKDCSACYTMAVTDKDEFIGSEPLVSALRKLDADPQLAFVVLPLHQRDRVMQDRFINFSYARMSGREYLRNYVKDDALQHCSIWGIMRVKCVRASGLPRPMNLRQFGLEDSFGIDLDFVLKMATQGDVDFEVEPAVRRSIIAGSTEKMPLIFAYTYFQYAKRVFTELRATKFIEADTERTYVAF